MRHLETGTAESAFDVEPFIGLGTIENTLNMITDQKGRNERGGVGPASASVW